MRIAKVTGRLLSPLLLSLIMAATGNAALISGQGDPTDEIPGGAVVDFEATPFGQYLSLVFPGVTIAGADDFSTSQMRVDNLWAGEYNSRDSRYLDNNAGEGYHSFLFFFDVPVESFAFLFGASNVTWVLTAYDGGSNVIETYNLPILSDSNAGDYFGIRANGIASATLSTVDGPDWVFVDNLTFATASTPEPGSVMLVGFGALGLIAARFRRK